jgi:hypothetical protein
MDLHGQAPVETVRDSYATVIGPGNDGEVFQPRGTAHTAVLTCYRGVQVIMDIQVASRVPVVLTARQRQNHFATPP